ncbi:mitochondrial carrier domain-containing protein, partial [Pavlovales sp. CCMP2436]
MVNGSAPGMGKVRSTRGRGLRGLGLLLALVETCGLHLSPLPRNTPLAGRGLSLGPLPSPRSTPLAGRRALAAAVAFAPGVLLAATTKPMAEAGGDIVWMPGERDPAAFADVLRTYNAAFVTYLARFLLNYDSSSKLWWDGRVAALETNYGDAVLRSEKLALFADFAASVQYGLRRYEGVGGVGKLFETLVRVHGSYPERRRHLALAFTFLEGSQPREMIAGLLRAGDGTPLPAPKFGTAPFSPALTDYMSFDPRFLLPPTQVPVWDANLRRYVVRGFGELKSYGKYAQQGYADGKRSGPEGSLLSVFGPTSKCAVQRERALTLSDYALFAVSGAAGCCFTHTLVTPLDVVKTRMQTSPAQYSGGLVAASRTIIDNEGWTMLFAGLQATIAGYSWYGMTVYPGYEFFSRLFEQTAGSAATSLHAPIVIFSGASATVLACIGVCPMEAARIRAVAQPDYAPGLPAMLRRIAAEDGVMSLYKGLGPIVLRQVIFGMVKFYTFDAGTDALFAAAPSLKATVGSQLLVSLLAGLAAGVASACVSQPADAILSEINRQGGKGGVGAAAASLWQAGGNTPARFFNGLLSRCVWSGSIISGQFFLYDIAKAVFGIASDDLLLFLDVQFKDLQL